MFYLNFIFNFLSKCNDFDAKFVTIVIFMYKLYISTDSVNYQYTSKKPIKKDEKNLKKNTSDDIKRYKYSFYLTL